MKILVTGGAGFIGSNLVDALIEQGHEVTVLDDLSSGKRKNINSKATFIEGDLQHINSLDMPQDIEVIFHLAALMNVRESVLYPEKYTQVNVMGTLALLQFANKHEVKKIVFSSTGGAIYGDCNIFPTPESHICVPMSPYGLSKWVAEQYIELFSRSHAIAYVNLRYSNVYGPRQSGSGESGVIAIFSEKALHDEPMVIFGDGEQTRDYVYVGDVVKANIAALGDVQGTFNIGRGIETNVNKLVEYLKSATGKELKVKHEKAKPGDLKKSVLDNQKAEVKLGWKPTVDLQEGLKLTLESLK